VPSYTKGGSAPDHFKPETEVGQPVDIDFAAEYPHREKNEVELALVAAGWIESGDKASEPKGSTRKGA
jgi:hypothetical protein